MRKHYKVKMSSTGRITFVNVCGMSLLTSSPMMPFVQYRVTAAVGGSGSEKKRA